MERPDPGFPQKIGDLRKPSPRGRLASLWLLGILLVVGGSYFWWRDDSWRRVEQAKVIRVGYAIEAPFAFIDARGRVTGEAPEIARAITKRLGLGEPEWVLTDFSSLLDELDADRFDVVASGLFVTEEREKRVIFSRPTTGVRPGLLVAVGNPHGLHSYADVVEKTRVRVAVLSGAVEADWLTRAGLPATRLVEVPDALSGLSLLKAGRVDGLALSRPTVRWMARAEDARDLVESAEPFAASAEADREQAVAHAFRRGERALRRRWDRELERFLTTDDYRRLETSFGFSGWQSEENN